MPDYSSAKEDLVEVFELGEEAPLVSAPENANIPALTETFDGIKRNQRSRVLPGKEAFGRAVEGAVSENRKAVRDATGLTILENLLDIYGRQVERADGEADWKTLEETVFVHVQRHENGTAVGASLNEERLEAWLNSPPETYQQFVSEMLDEADWESLASWAASHTAFWANEELNRRLEEEGNDPESLSRDRLNHRLSEEFEPRDYMERVIRLLRGELAVQVIESLHDPESDDRTLTPLRIERLLGLGDQGEPRPRDTAASSAELEGGLFPWATGKPASEGATAIRQAKHGWPETDNAGRPKYPFTQKRPHHVEGQFTIIVPNDNQAGAAVEAEMAQRVLDEFDRHTTRLHLACAAYSVKGDPGSYTPIPRQYVYDMLGIGWDQNDDESRDEKDRKAERAIRNLRKLGIQMRILDGPDGAPESLGLESVWNLNWHNWGQKRISDPDRILDTEHWELLVRPNAWHQLYLSEETGARQFGYFSRKLLENIDWHNNPAAGDLAIELLKYVRFQDGGAPRDLTVETMLGICGLGQAQQSYEQTRNRQKLERAILQQERWGWNVEWTRWPDVYQPDKEDRPKFPRGWWQGKKREGWERSFKEWKVTFYPPEDLAEMNSRAEEIDNSDPHELEPKWPGRIKAILNETEYIQADLARILEVTSAAVTQWKKGNRTPEGPHRAKLKDIERRNGLRNG